MGYQNKKAELPPVPFESKNMNYVFHVEYFRNLFHGTTPEAEDSDSIEKRNKLICDFKFQQVSPVKKWETIEGYRSFGLVTCYPGLMIGTGGLHSLSVEGLLKQGFTFDTVSGLPYLPGSSLKGILRSCFPGEQKPEELGMFLHGLLKRPEIDLKELETDIFEGKDLFLGAYPRIKQGDSLLAMEYITPHPSPFKNPNPISMIKVKPDVMFDFCFVLSDYKKDGAVVMNGDDKLELFRQLLLIMGIGAKTNVGFGKLREE